MPVALITGVAGFIGSTLADRLLRDGWEVVGVDSFDDYYARALKESNLESAKGDTRFRLIESNLLNLRSGERGLIEAVDGADVVFHLAAQAGVRASWGTSFSRYTDNNILATQLLLEQCKTSSTKRLVYASTSSVYGDTDVLPMREDALCKPYSPYGVSKLAAENLCYLYWRNFGVSTTALRFFTVYGPRQRPDMAFHKFIRAALDHQEISIFGDGEQTRDFTFVDDIVEGMVRAVEAPAGAVFNLGGGSRITVNQVLSVLEAILGSRLRVRRAAMQPGDVKDTWASLERAEEVLHYAPGTNIEHGLRREVEWIQSLG